MQAFLTTDFSADIKSIDEFYGWKNKYVNTWQEKSITINGEFYIIYKERTKDWVKLNNKSIVEIKLQQPNLNI